MKKTATLATLLFLACSPRMHPCCDIPIDKADKHSFHTSVGKVVLNVPPESFKSIYLTFYADHEISTYMKFNGDECKYYRGLEFCTDFYEQGGERQILVGYRKQDLGISP